jgi:DNA-binding beta-propeller fold protein YncE
VSSSRPIAPALLAVFLLGAGSRPAPLILYSAPAGTRPTGADKIHPTTAILPNGRIAAPAGASTFVGINPLGVAITPDGRYAIVSNDAAPPNSSLSVVDAKTMRVASEYKDPNAAFFMGVAAVRDPSTPGQTLVLASDGAGGVIRVFTLDGAGTLAPSGTPITIASGDRRAFPAQIAVAPNGRTAYVADNLGNAVVTVDIASRTVQRSLPVGDFPLYVAAGNNDILVSGTGLSNYAPVIPPSSEPQFVQPLFDASKSSTLTVAGAAGEAAGDPATVRMDPPPDGREIVGGAAPGATILTRNGALAYVALANVDRVVVVSLAGAPHVVRGLDLRLYPGAPYGAAPSAEALSSNGKRLYVALAGLNSIAVLDAQRPTRYRYGLIPTAWYPVALALSGDGRYLYVLNSKSVNGWGILQRVDLKRTYLVRATLDALRYNRTPSIAKFNPVIPPLRSNKRSESIDHVVYVGVGTQGYDALFGDLKDDTGNPHGNGDASLNVYPESVTPNLHALARAYAVADNFYASDSNADIAKTFVTEGEPTLYQQMVASSGAAREPMADHGDDPEDYGRAGYLFNALARAGITFRDYGGLLRLSGYDGAGYRLNVPALSTLSGNVDLDYAGWNPKITDEARAAEFVRDMQRYVQNDSVPGFTYVSLPAEGGAAGASDVDRALGSIVDFISHTPHWSSTAIFIVPEGDLSASDHVHALRTYALVVSPLSRRGYVGEAHLGMASVLKTEEEIFGLPPLALSDLLATDLAEYFTEAPSPEPYRARGIR